MTDEAMSPLRQRMIEDMTIRKFAAKTQQDYMQRGQELRDVPWPVARHGELQDVRRFQLHRTAGGNGVQTLDQTVATLRFFLRVTLRRSAIIEHTRFFTNSQSSGGVQSAGGGAAARCCAGLSTRRR